MRVLATLTTVLFVVSNVYGQSKSCATRSVPVSVIARNGERVVDLTAKDFRAEIGHDRVEITSVHAESAPKRVVIVFDTSGSMRGSDSRTIDKMQLASRVLGDALTHLPANIRVALLTFDDKTELELGFDTSRDQIAAGVATIQRTATTLPHGHTALWDAISRAIDMIPHPGPGDVIYAITDGGDNASRTSRKAIEEKLQLACVRLFTFLLDDVLTPEERFGWDEIRDLAVESGGVSLDVSANFNGNMGRGPMTDFKLDAQREQQVSGALAAMYRSMAAPYVIDVRMPTSLRRMRTWKLHLTDPKLQKNTMVYYPHNLMPCR